MKKNLMKLLLWTLTVAVLVSAFSFAGADGTVDVIMNAGTAQAFTDEAVPAEDLETILKAGLAAPSAINQQPWFFAAITNPDVMQEIAGSGFGAPGGSRPDFAGGAPEGFSGGAPEGAPEGFSGGAPEGGKPAGIPAAGGSSAKASVGDSPVAIVIYMDEGTSSPNAGFDCGLATQNMYIAAASLGYGVKIVSSPTMTLNGADHDALCEKLGVPTQMQAVAVLLIGKTDASVDGATGATARNPLEEKTSVIN